MNSEAKPHILHFLMHGSFFLNHNLSKFPIFFPLCSNSLFPTFFCFCTLDFLFPAFPCLTSQAFFSRLLLSLRLKLLFPNFSCRPFAGIITRISPRVPTNSENLFARGYNYFQATRLTIAYAKKHPFVLIRLFLQLLS